MLIRRTCSSGVYSFAPANLYSQSCCEAGCSKRNLRTVDIHFFPFFRVNRKAKWFRVGAGEQLDSAVLARITSRVFSRSPRRGHTTGCFSGGRITVSSPEAFFLRFTAKAASSYSLPRSFEVSVPLRVLFRTRSRERRCPRLPPALSPRARSERSENKEPEYHVRFF